MKILGEHIMTFGIILAVLSTLFFFGILVVGLWIPISDVVWKILGSGVSAGFFFMILGCFVPNNYN